MSLNEVLFQLIAARAGSCNNPEIASMLGRLNGTSGPNGDADPQELLSQLANGNPLLGALGKHFAEVRNKVPVIDVEPEAENVEASEGRSEAALDALQKELADLSSEAAALRERNDLLATALGACCLCWGENSTCRACRGRGRPGFAVPDDAAFLQIVLPAVRTMRAQRTKSAPQHSQKQGSESNMRVS